MVRMYIGLVIISGCLAENKLNNSESHRLCTGYVYAIHWTYISTGKRSK